MKTATKTLLEHAKGRTAVPLAGALLLLVSPLVGLAYGSAVASAILFGGAAALLWGKNALMPDDLDVKLMLGVGIATIAAPWLFGFGSFASLAVAVHTLSGLAVAGFSGYALYEAYAERKQSAPATKMAEDGDNTQAA